jgi:hypothetical protein
VNEQDADDPFRRGDEAAPRLVRTSRLARLAESSIEIGLTFGIASVLACAYSLPVIGVPLGLVAAVAFALPTIARARIARHPDLADAPALAAEVPRERVTHSGVGPVVSGLAVLFLVSRCVAALSR